MEGNKHPPPLRTGLYPEELADVCDWIVQYQGEEALYVIPRDVLYLMDSYGTTKRNIVVNLFNSLLEDVQCS